MPQKSAMSTSLQSLPTSDLSPRQRALLEEISRRLSERRLVSAPKKATIRDEESQQARRSLASFVKQSWHVLEPATEYLHNWHIDCISEHLEAVTAGEIHRLLINIPPRYMKTTIVSVMWPCWEWIDHPELRYVFDSYSVSLMEDFSVARRLLIQSPWYQQRFSDSFFLMPDRNQVGEFRNDHRGVMIANRSATGKGGNRVIVDDPLDPEQAHSEAERKTALRRFDKKLSTRLNDKRKDAIICVMQRLHEKDVSGRCIELGYEHLKLPGEAPHRIVVYFPTTGRVIVREPGDLLWPEREGKPEIETAKKALGSYDFAAQYQQEPAPVEGGIIKRAWWKFYRQYPGKFDEILQSWDLTFKDTSHSDLVAGQVWGRLGADFYLLDYVAERMDFIATLSAIRSMSAKWPRAKTILIEDAANGPAVVSVLKKELTGIVTFSPADYGSKEARVFAVSPTVEAGNVYLPLTMNADGNWSPAYFVEDFVRLCALFPNAEHDDPVDAFTAAIIRMSNLRKKRGVVSQNYLQN